MVAKMETGYGERHIAEAHWPSDFSAVAELFQEYQSYVAALGYDLSFQDFAAELAGLPGKYARPDGVLLIARYGAAAAGCIAYRRLEPRLCEMKRLYVRPSFRGRQIGELLCRELIRHARAQGYDAMRLDTGGAPCDRRNSFTAHSASNRSRPIMTTPMTT